jgi:hypothetical protein
LKAVLSFIHKFIIKLNQIIAPEAWSAAPVFGPVSAVTTTCSVMPVLSKRQISTSVSFSGIVTLGFSTPTVGSVPCEKH